MTDDQELISEARNFAAAKIAEILENAFFDRVEE